MKPVLVIDAVGLGGRDVTADTPHLAGLAARGVARPLGAVFPAVTCTAQATFLTGSTPAEHGVVGNGWYHRGPGEVRFWLQSNRLVQGEKLYERARKLDPAFTCAKLFWWWNMGAAVDFSITPRPFYPADGRKLLAVYGKPDRFANEMEATLGPFPFFDFWGPRAGLASSRWITDVALRTLAEVRPTLTLVYLPHLDYDHQRYGPNDPRSRAAVRALDGLVGELVAAADDIGAETVVLSEYAIEDVEQAVYPNRALREAGLLEVRATPVGETLDPIASRAFAVVDHQAAHVYTADDAAQARARAVLEELPGVERVLEGAERDELAIGHSRAGELVLVAAPGSWFAYPYWLDDAEAPDFARTVDIHRKPGYDPCELFVDPELRLPFLRVARRLLQKKLGMRYLMDVIPLDTGLVRGSHGRLPERAEDGPVFLASRDFEHCGGDPGSHAVDPLSVSDRILALLQRP